MDIVDRLRNSISNEENDGNLLLDAADEIEMLRKQLDDLIKNQIHEYDSLNGSIGC